MFFTKFHMKSINFYLVRVVILLLAVEVTLPGTPA
jgi:hypothetical protein